jgi:hypothetical protein
MSSGVPTFFDLTRDPFTVAVTAAGVAIPLDTWPASAGATAILTVQVAADGQSCAIRATGSSAAVTAFPDSALHKAKRDDAASINIVMNSTPIARQAVAGLRLVGSGNFTASCRWLVVAEPGT